jgi:hypothetical protein
VSSAAYASCRTEKEFKCVLPAGQLPGATATEVRTMNAKLAVFHDLTNK